MKMIVAVEYLHVWCIPVVHSGQCTLDLCSSLKKAAGSVVKCW